MNEILPVNVSALHADLMATVRKASADGIDVKDVFHVVARCFGTVMSESMAPDVALLFMKQEVRRMQGLTAADPKGTVQ